VKIYISYIDPVIFLDKTTYPACPLAYHCLAGGVEVAQVAPSLTSGPFFGVSFPFFTFFDVEPNTGVKGALTGGVEVHHLGAFDFLTFTLAGVSSIAVGAGPGVEADTEVEVERG
jgi:hypothetical protein